MISVIAHELTETASDPEVNAWYDSSGTAGENADKCAWSYGNSYQNVAGEKYPKNWFVVFLLTNRSNDFREVLQLVGGKLQAIFCAKKLEPKDWILYYFSSVFEMLKCFLSETYCQFWNNLCWLS